MGEGGLERSRRIPWHYQRQSLVTPQDSSTALRMTLDAGRQSLEDLSVTSTLSPIFIIAGPTAVGKSAIAVEVAERCGGEIVSADAFQAYEGLDILTAKPEPELLARVPHHLIGEVPRTRSFDVAQFRELAEDRIAAIRERGRIPIIVGGAGFYVKALTHGLPDDLPGADARLREELEGKATEELVEQLALLDPECHARIDRRNRRRLVRALEVCLLTGKPFSSFRERWWEPIRRYTGVVLNRSRDELHTRINQRTEAMFASGVVDEVRAAEDIGPTAVETLGCVEIQDYIRGLMTRERCIELIQQLTRQYAKRQLTWFRRETGLEWVEAGEAGLVEELVEVL